jgi:hypothetical protein
MAALMGYLCGRAFLEVIPLEGTQCLRRIADT